MQDLTSWPWIHRGGRRFVKDRGVRNSRETDENKLGCGGKCLKLCQNTHTHSPTHTHTSLRCAFVYRIAKNASLPSVSFMCGLIRCAKCNSALLNATVSDMNRHSGGNKGYTFEIKSFVDWKHVIIIAWGHPWANKRRNNHNRVRLLKKWFNQKYISSSFAHSSRGREVSLFCQTQNEILWKKVDMDIRIRNKDFPQTFFRLSSFVFNRKTNPNRSSKWWQLWFGGELSL